MMNFVVHIIFIQLNHANSKINEVSSRVFLMVLWQTFASWAIILLGKLSLPHSYWSHSHLYYNLHHKLGHTSIHTTQGGPIRSLLGGSINIFHGWKIPSIKYCKVPWTLYIIRLNQPQHLIVATYREVAWE